MPDRKITVFPVKYTGFVILDPTLIAQGNWTALCVITGKLFPGLPVHVKFHSRYHAHLLTGGREEIQC